MAELVSGGNGPQPGDVVITLTLRPTPQGFVVAISHPPDLFSDTVIDACLRAARAYERRALMAEWATAMAQMEQTKRVISGLKIGRG